jgi:hypothetical protein
MLRSSSITNLAKALQFGAFQIRDGQAEFEPIEKKCICIPDLVAQKLLTIENPVQKSSYVPYLGIKRFFPLQFALGNRTSRSNLFCETLNGAASMGTDETSKFSHLSYTAPIDQLNTAHECFQLEDYRLIVHFKIDAQGADLGTTKIIGHHLDMQLIHVTIEHTQYQQFFR